MEMFQNNKKFICPCCGYRTLDELPNGTFNICSICNWEDDNLQFFDIDYVGGANANVSLRQARKNFLKFGSSKKENYENCFTYENIAEYLGTIIPEFKDKILEHLRDNGEILNHPLLGDLTRFFVSTFYKRESDKPDLDVRTADINHSKASNVIRIADFIERLLVSGDPKLKELAVVSFLGNLDAKTKDYSKMVRFLGSKSRSQLKIISDWRP